MSLRTLALAFAALSLAACGGAQKRNARSAPEWPSINEAVPADVSYALLVPAMFDTPDAIAGAAPIAGAPPSAAPLPGIPSPLAIIEDLVGLDLGDPAALEQLGVDLEGELALWSSAVMPVLVARLDDPSEFVGLVDRILERNPDFVRSQTRLGAVNFDTLQTPAGWGWDIGAHEGWGVVRLRGPRAEMNVSDEQLVRSFRGYVVAERFVDTLPYADLTGRLDGSLPLRSVFYIETQTFSEAWRANRLITADLSRDPDEPELTVNDLYATEEQAEACALQAERVVTAVPWFGSASAAAVSGETIDGHQVALLHLGAATAERWADFLAPTFAQAADHAGSAAIVGALNVDIDTLHESIDADPALMACPDIAAFSGLLGQVRRSYNRRMNTIPKFFDGRFAGALYGVRMAGFAPFVDAAAAIGTIDPPFLMDEIQDTLRAVGGSGTVDETSALTTVNYRVMHLRVALSLLEDRVLATVGDVPTEFVNNAATGTVAESGPFMQLRVNGETLAPVLDVVEEYVFESGMIAENWVALFAPALDAMRAIGTMSVDGHLDADALVFDSRVLMRPAAAPVADDSAE